MHRLNMQLINGNDAFCTVALITSGKNIIKKTTTISARHVPQENEDEN